MNKKIASALILGTVLSITGCVGAKQTTKTSLEMQAIQSKSFETSKDIAFKSVVSVFQDLGYIIKSADKDTGFITAQSAAEQSSLFKKIMIGVSSSSKTNATAFVEEISKGNTKVKDPYGVEHILPENADFKINSFNNRGIKITEIK